MPRRSVSHVHAILLQMIRQDFAVTTTDTEKGHVWEVRHAGLLGIKYEVAVRSDLFEGKSNQEEGDGFDFYGTGVLSDDAVILWCVIGSQISFYHSKPFFLFWLYLTV
jgi:TATA-binding protein-associated factor